MRVPRLFLALLLLVTVGGFAQSVSHPARSWFQPRYHRQKPSIPAWISINTPAATGSRTPRFLPINRPWVSFVELRERNLDIEHGILEKATAGGTGRNAVDQRIGDLYGSCMDEKAANAKGIAPLKPELDRIAAVQDKGALMDEIAHLHLIGPNALFNFYSASDLHNADQVIAYIDQGGLSLPDRDYYIKEDADKAAMRQHLVDYATQLFTLAGQTPQQAAPLGAKPFWWSRPCWRCTRWTAPSVAIRRTAITR
jgi:hypothetical protein